MFKIISLVLLLGSTTAFASNYDYSDDVLIATIIAEELNESAPIKVDPITVLDEVFADKFGSVVFKYTIKVNQSNERAFAKMIERKRDSFRQNACSEHAIREILDADMVVKYRYYATQQAGRI